MKNLLLASVLFILQAVPIFAQNQSLSDNWVATDGIGRTLPTHKDVGDLRPNRVVGIFYYIWQGYHGDKVYDITKVLKGQGSYGPVNQFHFWGEPEYGYFRSTDPWVIRRDLQMFSNAKVDFIFFDVTNAVTYLETVNKLCEISRQMRAEGIQTPQIAFMTNSSSGTVMNNLYNDFYSKNSYSDLWFKWQGKPLIFGNFNDPALNQTTRNFFTIKYSWAVTDQSKPNSWQWLDWTPQDYGWSTDRNVPEQMTVTTAFHPENPHGQSFKNGKQPPVNSDYKTEFTGQGRYAQEQWDYAIKVDAPLIMVTQWNEWIAQRFIWNKGDGQYAGRPIKNGDTHFVDVLNEEFNRDMAPMKDGHTDNMYYQLVSNIRKYKGMAKPQEATTPATMAIDGDFAAWKNVLPVQWDPTNDVMHRNHPGYDPSSNLVNTTGRNDIVESRASYDSENIYFYTKTVNKITAHTDAGWMLLLINSDKNKSTGWNGYDYIINYGVNSTTQTTVKKWNGSAWSGAETTDFRVVNNELEVKVARSQVGLTGVNEFYYKWVDNPLQLNDMNGIFVNGDAAPDRRYDYVFNSMGVVSQTPFTGTPLMIPGTIETEDFDKGGQGVSYFDTDGANNGGAFRPNEGVDIQICQEGGFNTGWTFDGEWMEYTVNVATTGNYTVSFRVATPNDNCKFHLEFDGEDKTGAITVNNTGGYQTWTSVEKQVTLKAGTHIMRYYVDAASGGVNMNKFVFTSAGAPLLGTGTGLTGNYFNGMNFETKELTRVDETINFNWEASSPDAAINNDDFSVRWTGAIEPLYSENYTFYINSDNGRRLWINDQLIIDKWLGDWGTEYSGQISLQAGQQYTFKMEYFEEVGGANAKLEWESASQPRQVIAKTQLYPNSLVTASENSFLESGIRIYPNPVAGDYFTIDLSHLNESATASLYDATGNLIYSQQLEGENPKIPAPEKQGIYLLNLRGNNFNYATKLVISK